MIGRAVLDGKQRMDTWHHIRHVSHVRRTAGHFQLFAADEVNVEALGMLYVQLCQRGVVYHLKERIVLKVDFHLKTKGQITVVVAFSDLFNTRCD